MRQSDSFAKVGRAKQQPIKDDVNDSCSEDVQLKNIQAWLHRVHTQAMFLMTITSSLRINDFRALLKIQRERVMVMMLLQSWSRLIKVYYQFLFYVALVDYLWIEFEFMNLYKYFINDFKHF